LYTIFTGFAAGIKFYSQAENQVFRPAGRLVAPIHVKLGMADEHVGPPWLCKTSIDAGGGNAALKISKKSIFLYSTDFKKLLEAFIRTTILQKCLKFDLISFTGYGVIAEKSRVGHLPRISLCTL